MSDDRQRLSDHSLLLEEMLRSTMGSMVLCTLTHIGIIPNGFSNEFAHYFDFEESDY